MSRRPASLLYSVDESPSWSTSIFLALQHICILSVAFIFPVVIVNEIGGSMADAESLICMAMIATGLSTILMALNRGFIGSGYLCPLLNGPAFIPVSLEAGKAGGLALIFGMTAIGGCFEVIFSRFVRRMRAVFPAEVTGTVVLMVGVEVVPIAISKFFGVDRLHPVADMHAILVGLLTLGTMIGLNVWGKGKLRLYSLLIGLIIGYILAYFFGLFGGEQIAEIEKAKLFVIPEMGKFGWSFEISLLVPFLIATLSSALKTMGDLTTCQKTNDADWVRPDMKSIGKGILACGLGNVFSGLTGALGQSVSSANVGLSIATGATSRRIAWCIGVILIFLAFSPKVASVFVIMPTPVMGAAIVFAVCFMIVAGCQIIMSRMMDARKTFVVGLSIMFGLSADMAPHLWAGMPAVIKPLVESSLSIATLSAILLNLIFRLGVAKEQRLEFVTGRDAAERVFSEMERLGGAWGARRDVMNRAASCLVEMIEVVELMTGKEIKIAVSARFDEFNLNIVALYKGAAVILETSNVSPEGVIESGEEQAKLGVFMIQKYSDKVMTARDGDLTGFRIHFDH